MLIGWTGDNAHMAALAVIAALVALAVLSVRYGRDSRPGIDDTQDWQSRP